MRGGPPRRGGEGRDHRSRPIGVFDSGVGGLTVLHELLVRLPHEDFLYLGDTARFPYGERQPAEIERFSAEIAEELLRRDATHYPLIQPMLQRMLGPGVTLVSSGAALARQVEHTLSTRDLRNPRGREGAEEGEGSGGRKGSGGGEGDYRFLSTGDAEAFHELGTRFLQMPLGAVERVELAGVEVLA
jgi:glutamate racemase